MAMAEGRSVGVPVTSLGVLFPHPACAAASTAIAMIFLIALRVTDAADLSEAHAGHGVQLDAVRRLPGHVVNLVEKAEAA